MKKKIGIFTGYYPPHVGGVERYVDKLSSALEKRGYQIIIVTSNYDHQKNYEKLGSRSIYRLPIHKTAKDRYPIPKKDAEYKTLMARIEEENIDYYLLNTRFHLTSLVGAKMGRRQRRPVMLIEHGTGHFTVNSRILDFFGLIYEHLLSAYIKRYVDKFYGVSQSCNEWLKHFSIKGSDVFYNSVDAADTRIANNDYLKKYPKDEIILTYAGRLIKEKGILNLLKAFENVKKANKSLNIKLAIAGDGELLETIKQNYQDPDIALLGRLDFRQVMSLYKRTDIFVYPSLYPEGLPTSILEAGLMNCAVIATPRGGTVEVIPDRQHGIIVDGSVSSLTSAIEELATSPATRKKLSSNLKSRVEKIFNWDSVAKKVDSEINKFERDN